MSQPMAMRPLMDCNTRPASSVLSTTTVLATESARPKTTAAPGVHPQKSATAMPNAAEMHICTTAPGTTTLRTAKRSSSEK
jgi:hypothetical protein